ncbi:Feline leukemia virus subgroup C receptor-related protein 2 [Frankliniella fusca]|uniref:Feline leukemia virus subgroup C receptor-related protein 2 n=1 Tax=Frankliniella fusca TaxID=407009 RepID=A0AAE1H9E9_9NEOP|nr:Feline leukemia virus subgroup C receptor-related protein 2 [Frankliniella fusca]
MNPKSNMYDGMTVQGQTCVNENAIVSVKVFSRRWLVLGAFCLLSLLNSLQWVQYAIISDSVAKFYGVSAQAVDWASMVYMLMYIPFILPASWLLDNKGLRHTVVLAGVLNCLASWIKVASAQRDLYAVTMAGQTLAGITQAFILAVPARLAAVWFGAGEVATACAIGVFGNQVGTAVGFVVPPLIVSDYETMDELGYQLRIVFYGIAGASTLSLLLLLAGLSPGPADRSPGSCSCFADRTCISLGPRKVHATHVPHTWFCTSRRFLRDKRWRILRYQHSSQRSRQERDSKDAGNIGLIIVITGLLGSILCGVLLDATRKYKEVTLATYALSLVGMAAFTASFFSPSIWVLYVSSGFLGFFLTGYLPLGFELAAELTYPEPEGTSAGLLNVSAQVFGLLFTELCGLPLELNGVTSAHLWVNVSLFIVLALGTVLTSLVPNSLRRQAAEKK